MRKTSRDSLRSPSAPVENGHIRYSPNIGARMARWLPVALPALVTLAIIAVIALSDSPAVQATHIDPSATSSVVWSGTLTVQSMGTSTLRYGCSGTFNDDTG